MLQRETLVAITNRIASCAWRGRKNVTENSFLDRGFVTINQKNGDGKTFLVEENSTGRWI